MNCGLLKQSGLLFGLALLPSCGGMEEKPPVTSILYYESLKKLSYDFQTYDRLVDFAGIKRFRQTDQSACESHEVIFDGSADDLMRLDINVTYPIQQGETLRLVLTHRRGSKSIQSWPIDLDVPQSAPGPVKAFCFEFLDAPKSGQQCIQEYYIKGEKVNGTYILSQTARQLTSEIYFEVSNKVKTTFHEACTGPDEP